MKILQSGYAKSGNFWLYKIINLILEESEIEKFSYIKNHPSYKKLSLEKLSYKNQVDIDNILIENGTVFSVISTILKEEILDTDTFLTQTTHVWTHSTWEDNSEEIYNKFDKIIYVVRDPRDVAISMSKFHFTDYGKKYLVSKEKDPEQYLSNRFPGILISWVKHVGYHLMYREKHNIHFIFYENLLNDFDSEFRKLLVYLDLELDQKQINNIKNKVLFKNMNKENPSHVRKGKAGKWISELDLQKKKQAKKITFKLLKILNYSIDQQFSSPKILQTSKSIIQEAIKHSKGSFFDKIIYSTYLFKSKKPFLLKIKQGINFLFNK